MDISKFHVGLRRKIIKEEALWLNIRNNSDNGNKAIFDGQPIMTEKHDRRTLLLVEQIYLEQLDHKRELR